MRNPLILFTCITVLVHLQAHAAPSGSWATHLSSLLKWTKASSKSSQPDGNALEFESGYFVETIVEGNEIGVIPHKIRISEEGELFAVDSINSNIVKITPPLSQYSRARLVAGSFQGYKGHIDGKPSDARFNHPKGVTMDDKGNVYVADTLNLAIRKIVDSGVTTIAGGKSNFPGYSDGPGEDAKFSNDFDVIYLRPTCSLLVVDRGNAAIRQISLNQEDCDYEYGSVSASDVAMFVGALLVGYVTYMLQQGFGPSIFSLLVQSQHSDTLTKEPKKKLSQVVNNMEMEKGWASFVRLATEYSKKAIESLPDRFKSFIPSYFRSDNHEKGPITPLKDALKVPEDETKPSAFFRHNTSAALSKSQHSSITDAYVQSDEMKQPKAKPSRDPSFSNKHRHSRQLEYSEFDGTGMVSSSHSRSKSQKDRSRHRRKEKGSEFQAGVAGVEPKPAEMKTHSDNPNFDQYNSLRTKYRFDGSFHF